MKRILIILFVFLSIASQGQVSVARRAYISPEVTYPACLNNNTVAWYIADDLSTITKGVGDLVSRWNDKLGSGHDLIQATGTNKPVWSSSGIIFDANDNRMQTATFTLNQPVFIYMVMRQVNWSDGERIFDGFTDLGGTFYQRTSTPRVAMYAGGYVESDDLVVGEWSIVRLLFYGASSKIIVDSHAPVTGNVGSNNMAGFTLADRGSLDGYCPGIDVKEIIIRNVSDSAGDEAAIFAYLKLKYSL